MDPLSKIYQYVQDRDEAAASFDLDKFKAFIIKWNGEAFPMPSDDVLEITMRKVAVHCTSLDVDTRVEAFRWLLEHGSDFSLD